VRTLYLRIYLTVVAVLLLFALVSGWLLQRNIEQERERFQASASARLTAWSELLQNALPGADEAPGEQAQALLDWSQRLRVPLALDDAAGRRIATAPSFARVTGMPPPEPPGEPGGPGADDGPPPRPPHAGGPWHAEGARHGGPPDADGPPREPQRVRLSDGRVLWIVRPSGPRRPDGRPLFAEPPFARGAGLAIGLVLLFVAVAAGAYPVVRGLTRRLESLQAGVERFGAGSLSQRVDESGRDEVAAVARSFNLAAERVETLVRSHQSLLANASHELRSPLARLKMAVAMLPHADSAHRDALRREAEANIAELDALVE
jgi:HAMP domain-containing protein